jgi:hypothetical protein
MALFDFFRKKNDMPEFNHLLASPYKDKYPVRKCRWGWLDNKMIWLVDNNAPRTITLDPWPQLIYLAATGQYTITELVYNFAKKYYSKIPGELDKTILHQIETLLKEQLIELKDEISFLPDNILHPTAGQSS